MPVLLKMTSCQSASDVIAIHGVDKVMFEKFHDYHVISGSKSDFRAGKSSALIGERIAERYGWKTGAQVTVTELGGISFEVAGIFTTNGTADDFVILTGIQFLQEVDDIQGIANRIFVKLKPGENPDAAGKVIEGLPLVTTVTVQGEESFVSASLDQLRDVVKMSKVVIVIIVLLILVAVGNAISMATRDRTNEFGVLRTLGFQRNQIMALVLSEGVIQAAAGALLGALAVQLVFSASLVKSISTCGVTVALTAGPFVWFVGVSAVFAAGLLGSIIPAWSVSRIPVVEAIRRED
jgi:putative ABC transport system permease protein